MYAFRNFFPTVAALGLVALAGCGDAELGTGPLQPDAASLASTGPVLIECPIATDTATTATFGATGGAMRLKGHEMRVPLLALTSPTPFEMRESESNYMELTIRRDGASGFSFRRAVTVTIDYSRCTRENIDHAPLSVWQIDPATKALIENMGGVDDKVARTVTFQTDHLSTFSLAR